MARIFRYIVRNLLFAGWQAIFFRKESEAGIETTDPSSVVKKIHILPAQPKETLNPKSPEGSGKPISPLTVIRIILIKAAHHIMRLIVMSSLKITIEGKENIPADARNALIVANHSSYLDVPVLGYAFFDKLLSMSWVVSKSNYNLWFLKWLYAIFRPIVAGLGGTIDKIKDDLDDNRWVVIFPEGNQRWCPPSEARKRREKPSSGAAVTALSTGAVIIPVGITGADRVLPVRSFRLDTRYHITVKIGKSFSYTRTEDDKLSSEAISQAREEIMNRVYTLVYNRDYKAPSDISIEVPASLRPMTINDILKMRAVDTPGEPGFWEKSTGRWEPITWSGYLRKVEVVAANLYSLGLRKGDRAIIISRCRYEWEMFEKAFLLIGAVVCGIDPSASAAEIGRIANRVGPSVIVAEDEDILHKIPAAYAGGQKAVILIENKREIQKPGVIFLEDIIAEHTSHLPKTSIGADDTAVIIYTSGSSGEPKMIAYTHRQLVEACLSVSSLLNGYGKADRAISWLPLAYMTSRMFNLCAMRLGVQLYYVSDTAELPAEMKAIQPTSFIGVPRFFEKVYDAINKAIDDQPLYVRCLVRTAIWLGGNRGILGSFADVVSQPLIAKIRSVFGGSLKWAISGSAPLSGHILKFFDAIGIPVLEAYALSENAIPMSMNQPGRFKLGTVGIPLVGNEIRFAEDSEILVRGAGVFGGYYTDKGCDLDLFDDDGFLKTGDIGYQDKDGFLILTGRKKEIIKTSVGNRVSPAEVESVYDSIPYIDNIIVVGNGRKYISAVLTINEKEVSGWCKKNMIYFSSEKDLWALPEVRKLLEESIAHKGRELAGYKQIKKFAVLAGHFSVESGELTANLKLRRSFIEIKYKDEIERMYMEQTS